VNRDRDARDCVIVVGVKGAAIVAIGCVGCSVFMAGPPSERPTHGPIECESSPVVPIVDATIATGLAGAIAIAAIREPISGAPTAAFLVYGVLANFPLAFAGSAALGFTRSARCRHAKAEGPIYSDAEWLRLHPPPWFCTTSTVLTDLCFCSLVEADCTARHSSLANLGVVMSGCVATPANRCTARP
jgi:hypothetical protein